MYPDLLGLPMRVFPDALWSVPAFCWSPRYRTIVRSWQASAPLPLALPGHSSSAEMYAVTEKRAVVRLDWRSNITCLHNSHSGIW